MTGMSGGAREWRGPAGLGVGVLFFLACAGWQRGHSDEVPGRPAARPVAPGQLPQAVLAAREPQAPVPQPWHFALVRHRLCENRLQLAQRRLEAGRLHEAVDLLQSVLTDEQDAFIPAHAVTTGSRARGPRGAHHLAEELLAASGPEALRLYETLYGAEATRTFEVAGKDGDLAGMQLVARRYFHTEAGYAASICLAQNWMDRGALQRSAVHWKQVLGHRLSRQLSDTERLQAATCLAACGEADALQTAWPGHRGQTLLVAGERIKPGVWLETLACSTGPPIKPETLPASSPPSPPAVRHPLWQVSLAGKGSEHVEALVEDWERQQVAQSQPVGVSHFPIIVDGLMVFRDFSGIRVLDLARQQPLWAYRTASSLSHEFLGTPVAVASASSPSTAPSPRPEAPDPARFQQMFVGNRVLGMLSSDGRSVFAIDHLENRWQNVSAQAPSAEALATLRQSNTLVALHLSGPQAGQPRWTVGGSLSNPVNGMISQAPLAGHFFLGPPLAMDGRLYVMAEFSEELHLLCLRADTGAKVWSRPVCAVGLTIDQDADRYYRACCPVRGDGVVICPTQSGVLVAVDSHSGNLRWAYSYDDAEQLERLASLPGSSRQVHEHSGYPNAPLVQRETVVYLPAHSETIHCVDLKSGMPRWQVRREELGQSTEFVAATTSEAVVIVGRRRCRGVSLASGAELWSCPLPAFPAGRGTQLGQHYVVPLMDGTALCLEAATGRQIGFCLPQPSSQLGNLVAAGDLVISMGRTSVAAYPQASAWLERLQRSEATDVSRPEQKLLAAELQLLVGDWTAARALLKSVALAGEEPEASPVVINANLVVAQSGAMPETISLVSTNPQPASRTASSTTEQAEHLWREMLFAARSGAGAFAPSRAANGGEHDEATLLAELAPLVHTNPQRARYLMQKCEFERRQQDWDGLIATVQELLTLDLPAPVLVDDDLTRTVAVEAWVQGVLAQVRYDADAAAWARLTAAVVADLDETRATADLPRLRRLVRAYADWPQAGHARLTLAESALKAGLVQEVEMHLRDCRNSPDRLLAATATRMLAELVTSRGLPHDAALLLRELRTTYADLPVSQNLTGAEYAASLSPLDLGRLGLQRLEPPRWTGRVEAEEGSRLPVRVCIREERHLNADLQDSFNASGVQALGTPRGFAYDLFDRGRSGAAELVLLDRNHGGQVGHPIPLPNRYYYPVSAQQSIVGHLIPLGLRSAVTGISLFDGRRVWTTAPAGLEALQDSVRVGPAGSTFCAFQCRQHLFVVDPADGRVLWHRRDLQSQVGLMADPYAGIIGDEQILTVFDADRIHYTVYDTRRGTELRRGRLDIDTRQTRRVFGRLLFHSTRGTVLPIGVAENRILRIWDPLHDACVWEEPTDALLDSSLQAGVRPGQKTYTFLKQTDELAYITTAGRIRIVDVHTGAERLSAELEPELRENVGFVRVFHDAERYYVNVQRVPQSTQSAVQNSFIASDTTIPAEHVQGDVCAFDRRTQELVWSRNLGHRSILLLQDYNLPVLVSLCRVRNQNSQLSLRVEILDSLTSEPLETRSNLLPERMLQQIYDADAQTLTLRGGRSEVEIAFKSLVKDDR